MNIKENQRTSCLTNWGFWGCFLAWLNGQFFRYRLRAKYNTAAFFPVVNEIMLVLYNITLIVQNNLKYLAFVAQTLDEIDWLYNEA